MTQPADDVTTDPAEQPEGTDKAPTFEGDFDEERAKTAITKLREEVSSLKTDLAATRKERDDFKTAAEKTGTERDEALAEALKRAEEAERTLAIKEHNLPDDVVEEFADYLTGSPEEVKARAAKLAARLAPSTPEAPAADEPGETPEQPEGEPERPAPPARPRPALQPGHDTTPVEDFDPAAIAKQARATARIA